MCQRKRYLFVIGILHDSLIFLRAEGTPKIKKINTRGAEESIFFLALSWMEMPIREQ
jgi:hypothetical protein